jgi:hypothetical protein
MLQGRTMGQFIILPTGKMVVVNGGANGMLLTCLFFWLISNSTFIPRNCRLFHADTGDTLVLRHAFRDVTGCRTPRYPRHLRPQCTRRSALVERRT